MKKFEIKVRSCFECPFAIYKFAATHKTCNVSKNKDEQIPEYGFLNNCILEDCEEEK